MNYSPNVNIIEIDNSLISTSKSNSVTFFGGNFEQGDINSLISINNHSELRNILGRGNQGNANDWFQAFNFLKYSSNLLISRVCSANSKNACAEYPNNNSIPVRIDNFDDLSAKMDVIQLNSGNTLKFMAKNPGIWGNDLKIMLLNRDDFVSNVFIDNLGFVSDIFEFIDEGELGLLIFQGNDLKESFVVNLTPETPKYIENINYHSKLIYIKFLITLYDGNIGYYDGLNFLIDGNVNLETLKDIYKVTTSFYNDKALHLNGGTLEPLLLSDYNDAYELAKNKNISIDYIISNENNQIFSAEISEVRQDCITFIGCPRFSGDISEKIQKTIDYRMNTLGDFKFSYLISNYKKIFNNWTNKIDYVNLAGDVAGIRARADAISEKWFSSSGEERGQLDGELEYIINSKQLGSLYNKNINSFLFSPSGIKLNGDKMLVSFESALDRLPNRNLANVLSRELDKSTRKFVFEMLDKNLIRSLEILFKKYLEEVRVSRGIESYFVKIEGIPETNSVIVDILYTPKYSAEFVQVRMINSGGNNTFQSGSGV